MLNRLTRLACLSFLILTLAACQLSQPARGIADLEGQAAHRGERLLADFEGATPPGFFFYDGGGSTVSAAPVTVSQAGALARPGQTGENGVLQVTYNIAGGQWGGIGQNFYQTEANAPRNLSNFDALGLWFFGTNSGLTYEAEIQDNRSNPAADTAERFDVAFKDDFSGWRFLTFPFSTFTRAAWQPDGAPTDGLGLTAVSGWALKLPVGNTTFHIDDVQVLKLNAIADFEPTLPPGYFVYSGPPSTVVTEVIPVAQDGERALPGQIGNNGVLQVVYDNTTYAGLGQNFYDGLGGPQDWLGQEGVGFWFYGTDSGSSYLFEIQDNRSDPLTDTAERFDAPFTDDFTGWRFVSLPFSAFTRATDYQPPGAPNDGLNLDAVSGWALKLPQGSSTLYLDAVSVLGSDPALRVGFSASSYSVEEGAEATITVNLTVASEDTVTVQYATSNGTAQAGVDYVAAIGTLTFAPGTTTQTFTVSTIDNDLTDGKRTVILELSNPVRAGLAANATATLTIHDNEFSVPEDLRIIDDFEAGLLTGQDGGVPIGFTTFNGAGSTVSISTAIPPVAVPDSSGENQVMKVEVNVTTWAGFVHNFMNEAGNVWVSQDWSAYEGFGFWFYGTNSNTTLFVDILDNRNPGSTVDDAERFSLEFRDDFTGWRYLTFPFSDFRRKDVGNGAPNDGFGLTEVHGWAFGTLGTGGLRTFYLDDAGIYGTAAERPLTVSFSTNETLVTEGSTATITVRLNHAPEEAVTVDYSTEPGTAAPHRDYLPASGSLTFAVNETEKTFTVSTIGNNKHDGDKTVILQLTNPQGAEAGFLMQSVLVIQDNDPFDPALIDDFEKGAYLWHSSDGVSLETVPVQPGEALALPSQSELEHVLKATVQGTEEQAAGQVEIRINGNLCNNGNGVVPVALLGSSSFDIRNVDHTTVRFGNASETHTDRRTGQARRQEVDINGDGRPDLLFHFRVRETGYDCSTTNPVLTGQTFSGEPFSTDSESSVSLSSLGRDFAIGQDWRNHDALSFLYYGTGSGEEVTVTLKGSRAPDPGPSEWTLVWSDEFDAPAGTSPNPAYWSYEIGDGSANRIPGWGNAELQYYTDSTENVAHDGHGNLVITAREADGNLMCYYGPCEYTSARLLTRDKAEFAYGRIEARIQIPYGQGLWPAFWSLGTDIDQVGWPRSGEIDIMENIGREPSTVHGTVHGPGYSGGSSIGGSYELSSAAFADSFHVFAVEWEPDVIRWYVDGNLFFTITPNDTPGDWVFNHPFFLLLNVAVGGQWPGYPDSTTTFPQTMKIDYVRVYQAADTAERFEASFIDNFSGWQKVTLPFSSFERSAEQPDGAPDAGLKLSEIWGYGFSVRGSGSFYLDRVRLE